MPPTKKRKTTKSGRSKADECAAEISLPEQPEPTEEPQQPPQPEVGASSREEANSDKAEQAAGQAAEQAAEQSRDQAAEASTTTAATESAPTTAEDAAVKARERIAKFRALQARAKTSSDQNLKEATKESQRLAADPSQLTALGRKHAIASQKLLKASVEDSGEDFERKRAWDWTVEESEAWDKRMRKREGHRDDNAFQDYRRESQKVYKRQLRNMAPDLEKYTREKMAAIEKAAAAGTLEIVETEDGELIAVDKDGSFYSTADSTAFAENKPDKAAIDRLVNDMKKAEAVSLKKRRDRMAANGDDADVTHINEKNKQFNQKLARFYNKYTAEIRDSFERGTMI